MRTRAFFFLTLRSAAPSEASRHFSQDRQLRAKFFVTVDSAALMEPARPRAEVQRPDGGPSPFSSESRTLTRCEREAPLRRRVLAAF